MATKAHICEPLAPSPSRESGTARIAGLDTIRLAAALIVAMSHGMLIPPRIYANSGSNLEFWSRVITSMLMNGPAAVAVFFVISGLCIHLGRESVERNPLLFVARRMVRIGIPMLAIIFVAKLVGGDAIDLEQGVLWSVYCEISYYLSYPLLLVGRRRWGFDRILWISIAISIVLVLTHRPVTRMWEYGLATALICYPLWIIGAMLAEHAPSIGPRPSRHLWVWRAGMPVAAAGCAMLRHFEWANYLPAITYAVIGALAVPFLSQEIAHAKAVPVRALAERLGKASYSLYLVHIVPLIFLIRATRNLSQWIVGPLSLAIVAISALTFYFLCEKPSLLLARAISFAPRAPFRLVPRRAIQAEP